MKNDFRTARFGQRVVRFLTMNSSESSTTGSGGQVRYGRSDSAAVTRREAGTQTPRSRREESEQLKTTRNEPGAGPAPLDDVYPESIIRSFSGIPRDTLLKLSQDTVNSLGGWKIVKADPAPASNCPEAI